MKRGLDYVDANRARMQAKPDLALCYHRVSFDAVICRVFLRLKELSYGLGRCC